MAKNTLYAIVSTKGNVATDRSGCVSPMPRAIYGVSKKTMKRVLKEFNTSSLRIAEVEVKVKKIFDLKPGA